MRALCGAVFSDQVSFDYIQHKNLDLFDRIKTYIDAGFVMNAGSKTDNAYYAKRGIVPNHGYSLLDARQFDTVKLVQLRNPWGCYEWQGPWSDASAEWDAHPGIKRACAVVDRDDGAFWMEFDEFSRAFSHINFAGPGYTMPHSPEFNSVPEALRPAIWTAGGAFMSMRETMHDPVAFQAINKQKPLSGAIGEAALCAAVEDNSHARVRTCLDNGVDPNCQGGRAIDRAGSDSMTQVSTLALSFSLDV